uniref:Uncharacterized protein n=1 Tax=Romanomermis culicivorax TaxID=13658 RepID=A0A915K025_ROMCU
MEILLMRFDINFRVFGHRRMDTFVVTTVAVKFGSARILNVRFGFARIQMSDSDSVLTNFLDSDSET